MQEEPMRPTRGPTPASRASMHQVLRVSEDETKKMAPMKWDTFVKVKFFTFPISIDIVAQLMRGMGFKDVPDAPGSGVRFDPPNPNDVSITFHKPHPDPTIYPVMLREFAKKLKKNYGWSEAGLPAPATDQEGSVA
ncbi:hypothetical protein C8R47DRAFT_284996 [Mycena vitilis]|nr:hypothetical protein C8R47DRAFT_284996 [Mycena vitilis]